MANINLGRVSPLAVGEYDSTIVYDKLDIVNYQGSSYIAKKGVPAGTSITNNEYWQLLAEGAGQLSIGTVNTVSASTGASASITGNYNAPVLNLNIPRGVAGNESIDDTAGEGDTDKVWSADKSYEKVTDLKSKINNLSIADLSEYEEIYGHNLLNGNNLIFNKLINTSNGLAVDYEKGIVTDYMPVEYNHQYVFCVLNSGKTSYSFTWCRYAVYDENKNFLYGNTINNNGDVYQTISITDISAKYIRCSTTQQNSIDSFNDKNPVFGDASYWISGEFIKSNYEIFSLVTGLSKRIIIDLENKLNQIDSKLNSINNKLYPWKGKTWLSYGDSITAIGNGNTAGAWQEYVTEIMQFSTQIVRGIGGQKYKWTNNGGSVAFVNSTTGEYDSRNDDYNKDNYTGNIPDGCVAIRGCFCSWDRIVHMIPDNIKNDIDLIFLFGVNDGFSDDVDDYYAPQFITGNTTDIEWTTAIENSFGGDFDITTLPGAIASTLLKLQIRCPNALIVTGTSWSGRGDESGINYPNVLGIGIFKEGEVVEKVSKYFSFNTIDLYHILQVNPWNRATYVTDTIHPYNTAGKKALARAVISGLQNIYPKI